MKKFVSKNWNIERFLTMGDLDVRKIAAENRSLSADCYFSMIEKFMENQPHYVTALQGAGDPAELKEIKNVLSDIGYDKFTADIDYIYRAVKNGGNTQALEKSGAVVDGINTLYGRLKNAYILKRFHRSQLGNSPADTENALILLSEALEYYDHEEAIRKPRILAVDDVAIVLNTLTSVLSSYYEVYALTKAAQVENFLTHTTPELFLLDIEMPDLNGYELVRLIRQHDAHRETPIVFLTGNASMENFTTAMSLGVCDFITKPINPDILLEKISAHIVRKKTF